MATSLQPLQALKSWKHNRWLKVAERSVPDEMKVLVTGASGFIGNRLIEKLAAEAGFTVTALVRDRATAQHHTSNGIRTVPADMSNRVETDKTVDGHHAVINLAHDFKRSRNYNLRCFHNLSEACIRHGVRHLVQVSSVAVYDDWPSGNISEESSSGRPGTEYKNTKVAIEKALQRSSESGSLHSTILQPTIVYGPGSRFWTDDIVEKLLTGTVVLPAGMAGICNAVYVDDVADALVLAASRQGVSGEKYIISGSAPPTWSEFFESHNQYLGTDSIEYVDADLLARTHAASGGNIRNIWANPLQLANLQPVRHALNLAERVVGDRALERLKSWVRGLKKTTGPIMYYPSAGDLELYCSTCVCSIEKAKKGLGYLPQVDFERGFELTATYIDSKFRESHFVRTGPFDA